METPKIRTMNYQQLFQYIGKLHQQREKLLMACKHFIAQGNEARPGHSTYYSYDEMKTAIEFCEGKEAGGQERW